MPDEPLHSPPIRPVSEVTDADREAAAGFVRWQREVVSQWEQDGSPTWQFFVAGFSRAILQGIWDEHPVVQAFARHRQSATAELVEALREARDAIKLVVEGNPKLRNKSWRADGQPSENDECPHGRFFYESCDACTDATLEPVLAKLDTLLTKWSSDHG